MSSMGCQVSLGEEPGVHTYLASSMHIGTLQIQTDFEWSADKLLAVICCRLVGASAMTLLCLASVTTPAVDAALPALTPLPPASILVLSRSACFFICPSHMQSDQMKAVTVASLSATISQP